MSFEQVLRPNDAAELNRLIQGADLVRTDQFGACVWERSTKPERELFHRKCQALPKDGQGPRPLDMLYADQLERLLQKIPSESAKGVYVERKHLSEIVDYQPENQVITVQAGINLLTLNDELAKHGQTIPYNACSDLGCVFDPTYCQLYLYIESNWPHALMAKHGSWRDWVLASKIVLADGSVVSSGAKVVKNVTGYDLHRLVVGARGTLGLLTEVTLKTTPISSLREPEVERGGDRHHGWSGTYHRVLATDWTILCTWIKNHSFSFSLDHAANQAVYSLEDGVRPPHFEWEQFQSFDYGEPIPMESTMKQFMKRAKEIFDPTNKLNPGEFGFI